MQLAMPERRFKAFLETILFVSRQRQIGFAPKHDGDVLPEKRTFHP